MHTESCSPSSTRKTASLTYPVELVEAYRAVTACGYSTEAVKA